MSPLELRLPRPVSSKMMITICVTACLAPIAGHPLSLRSLAASQEEITRALKGQTLFEHGGPHVSTRDCLLQPTPWVTLITSSQPAPAKSGQTQPADNSTGFGVSITAVSGGMSTFQGNVEGESGSWTDRVLMPQRLRGAANSEPVAPFGQVPQWSGTWV